MKRTEPNKPRLSPTICRYNQASRNSEIQENKVLLLYLIVSCYLVIYT